MVNNDTLNPHGNIVIGIDPGINATGFGIIKGAGNNFSLIDFGVIRTKAALPMAERLFIIFEGLKEVIKLNNPTTCAVETVFYSKNPKTSLILGHVRGIALLAPRIYGISIYEYSPLEVKKATVGYGMADKHQVKEMVKRFLGIAKGPPMDASDALAVAICHLNSLNFMEKVIKS